MADTFERLKAALADRYAIEHELGAGGMATVYLAEDLKHHRKVAVKVLRPELAAILGPERFLREIEIAANLQHPHILPLHDSGEADSFLYYVMPYVEGESLREKLNREKQLGVDETVEIAKGVAAALDYAHRRDVIHRDIKPENILLHDGQPVVADFGIALAVSAAGGTRLTETGLSLGTPHYMSPEQATAERELDGRSDVYSLACVLYEMLAGDPPHTGSTMQAVLAKIVTDRPRWITELRDTVPEHVADAVHKALAKVPADRFETASDFVDALEGHAAPVVGGRQRRVPVSTHGARTRAVGVAFGVVLALLVGFLFGTFRSAGDSNPAAATQRLAIHLPNGYTVPAEFGPPLAVSHDGQTVVFAALGSEGLRLFVRPLDGFDAVMIEGSDGARSPFFSPDDESIGFFTPTALKRVHIDGGTPQEITQIRGYFGSVGSWGSNDSIVMSIGPKQGLLVVAAEGGASRQLTQPRSDEYAHGGPHVLPGGRGILFTVATDDSSFVAAFDTRQNDWRILLPGAGPQFIPPDRIVFARAGSLWTASFDVERMVLTSSPTPLPDRAASGGPASLELPHVSASASGVIGYAPYGAADGPNRVAWVERDGRVTSLDFRQRGHYMYPDIGPNDRRLAVALSGDGTGRDVWMFDLRNGTSSIVSQTAINYVPTWTRDGTTIAFNSPSHTAGILARVADRSAPAERIVEFPDSSRILIMGRWGAGRTLAFGVLSPRTGLDIWVQDVASSDPAFPFAATIAHEGGPNFSPDGSWLAYVSDEQGRYDVYARRLDGTGPTESVSIGGGQEPIWSADGSEIFYRTPSSVMVVDVTWTDGGPAFGRPRVLFEGAFELTRSTQPNYDVTSDGQRFLMVQRSADAATVLHIVTNPWRQDNVGSRNQDY